MLKDILDPKVDFIFKKVFGSEKHKEILIAFLNSVFGNKGTEEEIVNISIENPEIDKDWEDDKFSRLDIKATTSNDNKVNIEIQLKNQYNMKKRTLYYWSKLYESQMKSGDPYNNLERAVTINILNFTYLKENDRYHNAYVLKEKETNEMLTNLEEIHFIELPKLDESEFESIEDIDTKSKEDDLVSWALFLKNPQSEVMKMLEERIEELKEAAERLEVLSHDEETREIYESRQKAIHDQITNIQEAAKEAREEGKKEGIEEGRKKEKRETAENLIKIGLSIEEIQKATGLSKQEIEELA
jgi:predicted transposase/invertase (TIGR01784 family)